jgi:Fe2+ or Zn2+ uptake regulation protein
LYDDGVDDDLHGAISARLRRVGQRYTGSRRTLVEAMVAAGRPVTIAELMAVDRSLPQSTAYRNLGVLEQAGVVVRIRASDEFARFELSEELSGHHHHLVCIACGSIEDFSPSAGFERSLANLINGVARDAGGFRPQDHRLDLLGTCADCSPG